MDFLSVDQKLNIDRFFNIFNVNFKQVKPSIIVLFWTKQIFLFFSKVFSIYTNYFKSFRILCEPRKHFNKYLQDYRKVT